MHRGIVAPCGRREVGIVGNKLAIERGLGDIAPNVEQVGLLGLDVRLDTVGNTETVEPGLGDPALNLEPTSSAPRYSSRCHPRDIWGGPNIEAESGRSSECRSTKLLE